MGKKKGNGMINSQDERTDYSRKLSLSMEITDPIEARVLFAQLVNDCQQARIKEGKSADLSVCISIQKQNLGYFAGYYDSETRERVERLFDCQHPIFGSIKKNGVPSWSKAFNLGLKLGKKLKQKSNGH